MLDGCSVSGRGLAEMADRVPNREVVACCEPSGLLDGGSLSSAPLPELPTEVPDDSSCADVVLLDCPSI